MIGIHTMEQVADLNKKIYENGFSAWNSLAEQSEKALESWLKAVPQMPESTKTLWRHLHENSNQVVQNAKKSMDAMLSIKVNDKDVTTQALEVYEENVQNAWELTEKVQEQNVAMVETLTKALPAEGKQAIKLWEKAVKEGMESGKGIIAQNFTLAKKMVAEPTKKTEKK